MDSREKPGLLKVWITAVRPFAYTASVAAVLLGAAVAYHAGAPVRWGLLLLTLIGVVCFHTTANLLNDCFDYRRGLDTDVLPTSGAVVRGWLSERQAFAAAMLSLAAGVACGLVLTWLRGWFVLQLGLAGTVIALGYTTARYCLKYGGLGDVAIFLAFGFLPVVGAYWVQAASLGWAPVLWSIPLCSYTVAILHANNWRDIERDRARGCRTPAVMLGSAGSAVYYRLLILGPYLFVAAAVAGARLAGLGARAPVTLGLTVLSLPLALKLARVGHGDGAPFAMLDGKTAQLHTAFGILLVAGFVLGKRLPHGFLSPCGPAGPP